MMLDHLAVAERRKYEKMWNLPEYQRWSPGKEIAPRALEVLKPEPGSVIADFGCGAGQAVKYFEKQGFEAYGIDHVPMYGKAKIACLWDLPSMSADYGFCADVMEHIPTHRVEDVLRGIRRTIKKSVFFQIATRPDTMGSLIGEKLHMTVQPMPWWCARLSMIFAGVKTGDVSESEFWVKCDA